MIKKTGMVAMQRLILLIAVTVAGTGGLLNAAQPAVGASMVDPLVDWHMTISHTGGLVFDTSNADKFINNMSRVKMYWGTSGGFEYYKPGVTAVSVVEYYFRAPTGSVVIYGSTDGTHWYPLGTDQSDPTLQTDTDWRAVTISSTPQVPPNTNYIGIELNVGAVAWSPEIGYVSITYGSTPAASAAVAGSPATSPGDPSAPTENGPLGFSAISGSTQAYLDWFPVPGAMSYNVLRRRAEGSDFSTIAADVPYTYYSDQGLKPSEKYYYAITANLGATISAKSDLVLVSPQPGAAILADAFDDWNSAAAHTSNLTLDTCNHAVQCVKRTTSGRESIKYKAPGLTMFAFDASWNQGAPADELSVDVSPDGVTWSSLPIGPMLPPVPTGSRWLEAAFVPYGKVPSGTNFVRIDIGHTGDPTTDSPYVSDVRMTYGAGASPRAAATASAQVSAPPASSP